MRVGLLLPSVMRQQSIQLAEAIRAKPTIELRTIIGLRYPIYQAKLVIILAKILERWGVLGKIPKLNTIFEESTVYKNNGPFKIATAKEYANYFNIPFWYSRNTNSRKTARILRQAELDAVVCYSAGILGNTILDNSEIFFLNAHAGKLPKYGGMNVIEWAIFNDDQIYGTIHKIDKGIDTGDILMEKPLDLKITTSLEEIRKQAFDLVWKMVPNALEGFSKGELKFYKQSENQQSIQWFRMHPKLLELVHQKISSGL